MQEKFHHIFGLSRTAPICATGEQKDNITKSESGLFLDEMDDLNLKMVPSGQDCLNGKLAENSIFLLAERARNNALKELETTLIAGLNTFNKLKKEPFTGFLGSTSKRGYYDTFTEGQTVTTVIKTAQTNGSVVRINSIGLHTSTGGIVPVTINDTTYQVSTDAGTLYQYKLPEPLTIPLDGQDIVISYAVEGFMVGANPFCYGCAGTLRKLLPYFPAIEKQEANGLVLNIDITCVPDNVIYANYATRWDVKNVLAYAARFKTAELLIERILNSTEITRYTMMDNTHLQGKRNHFRKEFQDRINWLISTDGLDLTADGCYQCKQEGGFKKRGILI